MRELEKPKTQIPGLISYKWFPWRNQRFLSPHAVKQPFWLLDPAPRFPAIKAIGKKNKCRFLIAVPTDTGSTSDFAGLPLGITSRDRLQTRICPSASARIPILLQETSPPKQLWHQESLCLAWRATWRNYSIVHKSSNVSRIKGISLSCLSPNLTFTIPMNSTLFPHHLLQACTKRCSF